MEKTKIKINLDYDKLEGLGYIYSIMEGGYISKDEATIISTDRRPYEREVSQYRANVGVEHMKNVEQLREFDIIE